MKIVCLHPGCTVLEHARGLCNAHYKAARKPVGATPCACGCGAMALRVFVNGHNTRLMPAEEQARRGQLNDGSALRDTGACKTYRKVGQRHEHRTVAEQKLGRPLLPGEIVHHEDLDKRNNAPGNLEVMTQAEHARLHHAQMLAARKVKRGY